MREIDIMDLVDTKLHFTPSVRLVESSYKIEIGDDGLVKSVTPIEARLVPSYNVRPVKDQQERKPL